MAKHDKHKPADDEKEQAHKHEHVEHHEHIDEPEVSDAKVDSNDEQVEEEKSPEKPEAHEDKEEPVKDHGAQHGNVFQRSWHWALTHKKISIPVAVVLLLALLVAIPFTRYLLAGTFIKQTFPVVVVDSNTGKPVSSATVVLHGVTAETDSDGRADIRAKVGNTNLEVTKKYYEDSSQKVLVPLKKPGGDYEVKLKATGRAVPVTVLNSITQKPAANVSIKVVGDEETEAKTDDEGKATLVVPADKQEANITLSGDGLNNVEATLTVTTEETETNTFSVTPSGKIYFLSNASGKLDLVKSNLDGTDRQTVLAGTGKEDKNDTVLLASRDWKYIALLSKRDGGEYPKLFLIETETDKLTTMDEGEANFNVYGWSNDRFVYKVSRDKVKNWEQKQQSLKSYHAPSKKITTLADSAAENAGANSYVYNYFGDAYILGEEILYAKNWSSGGYYGYAKLQEKQAGLESIKADGSQAKTIKNYPADYIQISPGEFEELYIAYYQDDKTKYDEYEDGKAAFLPDYTSEGYPIYAVSPSGDKTLWSENRDGKNVFFVGDGNGENGKEIGRSDEFTVYGWFTDDYIMLTKKGSEMHIMPADGLNSGVDKSLKVTDYYKPYYYNRGFGYGYGG